MKRILVLAYQISTYRGSEYSVGWNYIVNMSKDNELVVFYGTSGNHMGDTEELEKYLLVNNIQNVTFIAVKPNSLTKKLNKLNEKDILNYSFYLAYNNWHKQVYKVVKDLVENEKFDLIHFLNPIGYREPGYLWKLNLPYIWGPIGGTNNVPKVLMESLALKGKIKLGFRTIVNFIQLRINPRLKHAINRSDVLLTSTTIDQFNLKRIYNKECAYLPENGIINGNRINIEKTNIAGKIKIIWIGRIDANKALIILLKALVKVNQLSNIHLDIVGTGNLKESLEIFAEENLLSKNVTWHGSIPREKVFELLSKSQLHVITSLIEANTTVIWEAMSVGVPTMSLDHCGMHDTICEKCGVKIPIIAYEQVTNEIAVQLDKFVLNPLELNNLSNGVIECAKKYNWDSRRDFFNQMYDVAIKNWENKQKI